MDTYHDRLRNPTLAIPPVTKIHKSKFASPLGRLDISTCDNALHNLKASAANRAVVAETGKLTRRLEITSGSKIS